jgi:hypothetical protein
MYGDYDELERRIKALEDSKCCHKKSTTLSADGSIVEGAGTVTDLIVVKSEGNLAALTIGTTLGGTDVLTAQAVTAGTWTNFSVFAFNTSAYTLYFGGITSPTIIKVYTR